MSRGLRNNNPGNIRLSAMRYRGEVVPSADIAFKQFETMAWGYRAIFMLLDTYRVKHGLTTLRGMIGRYAPPCENDTGRYLAFVAYRSGVDPDVVLDTRAREQMVSVVGAMSRMENGVEPIADDVEAGWELFVKYRS